MNFLIIYYLSLDYEIVFHFYTNQNINPDYLLKRFNITILGKKKLIFV